MKQKVSKQIPRNILFNPGPATTTEGVKSALVQPDICPREEEFGDLLANVKEKLLEIARSNKNRLTDSHDVVLIPCSGTGAIEAVLGSSVDSKSKVLVLDNGSYGNRIAQICARLGLNYKTLKFDYLKAVDISILDDFLNNNNGFTHLAFVHHETSSGILNNLSEISKLAEQQGLITIVDAMSSFAAIPIDLEINKIDYLISSSNKCLHAFAGLGIIYVSKYELKRLENIKSKSYYFDILANYKSQILQRQFLFTPPVQIIYALNFALDELLDQGGINKRYNHYVNLYNLLIAGMKNLGFDGLIDNKYHSKILTCFYKQGFAEQEFAQLHDYLYRKNITIYPGKLTSHNSFRVANMGDIVESDIKYLLDSIYEFLLKQPF